MFRMSMKLKKAVRENIGTTDVNQGTKITALETAVGSNTSGSETGIYKDIKDIKGDIGASDTASGSLKKRCKDLEDAIGDADTPDTILYRLYQLEHPPANSGSGTE